MQNVNNIINMWIEKYDQYLNVYLMFAVVFLYHLLFIFQGFDATDFGFHMTHQVLAFSSSPEIECLSPMIYLTDFIGGAWLSLIGHPSVLWARIGGVLLVALNASIVFSILSHYFEKRRVFFVVFVSSLFITMNSNLYIHYFTFPALLVNIELWIFNNLILDKNWSKKSERYSFLLGFMIIPIVLGRITLLLIGIIPLLFVVYYHLRGMNYSQLKKIVIPASKGFFIAMIFFGLFYWYLGILDSYLSYTFGGIFASAKGDTTKVGSSHTMSNLLVSYIIDYIHIAIGSLIIVFWIYILSIIKEKIGQHIFDILMITSTIGGLSLLLISGFSIDFFSTNGLKVSIGIIIILSILYFIYRNQKCENINLLLISSLTIMITNPIGSDCGVFKSIYGMWLILPLTLLCTYKIKTDIKNKRIVSMLSLISIILISVLLTSVFFQITNVYRDDQNRLNLNTKFSDPTLRGIYSTSDRVEVVDEFLKQVRTYSNKDDKILMVNNIPTFYYLTETKPVLGNPWLLLKPIEQIKENQQKLKQKENLPKLFIYSKVNTRNRNWPNTDDVCMEDDKEKLEYLENQYIGNFSYSLLWENEAFVIYGKEPETKAYLESVKE